MTACPTYGNASKEFLFFKTVYTHSQGPGSHAKLYLVESMAFPRIAQTWLHLLSKDYHG